LRPGSTLVGLPTYLSGHLLVYPIVGYEWVVCSSPFSFSLLPLGGKYYRLEIGILKGWGENMKIAKKKRKKEPMMTAHTNTEASELAKHCIKALAMGCSHVLIEMCHCLLNGIDMKEKKTLTFICQGNREMEGDAIKPTEQGHLGRFDAEAMTYCLINFAPDEDPKRVIKKLIKASKIDKTPRRAGGFVITPKRG